MDGQKPDSLGTAVCETAEHTGRSHSRGNPGTAGRTKRTPLRNDISRSCHRVACLRAAGAQVGGRGLCGGGNSPYPRKSLSTRRTTEKRGSPENRSEGRGLVCATAGLGRTPPLKRKTGLQFRTRLQATQPTPG